jgi:ribosome-binding factor A
VKHRNKQWKGRAHGASPEEIFESALLGEELSSQKSFNAKADHKTRQLCRQAQRALTLALAGECADEVLRDLYVESVEPMGSAAQLLVHVALPSHVQLPVFEVLARLESRSARLRAIVAQSICRKKAPNLSFIIAPAAEGGQP